METRASSSACVHVFHRCHRCGVHRWHRSFSSTTPIDRSIDRSIAVALARIGRRGRPGSGRPVRPARAASRGMSSTSTVGGGVGTRARGASMTSSSSSSSSGTSSSGTSSSSASSETEASESSATNASESSMRARQRTGNGRGRVERERGFVGRVVGALTPANWGFRLSSRGKGGTRARRGGKDLSLIHI